VIEQVVPTEQVRLAVAPREPLTRVLPPLALQLVHRQSWTKVEHSRSFPFQDKPRPGRRPAHQDRCTCSPPRLGHTPTKPKRLPRLASWCPPFKIHFVMVHRRA